MTTDSNIGTGQGSSFIDQGMYAKFNEDIEDVQQLKEYCTQLGVSDTIAQSDPNNAVPKEYVMEFPRPDPPAEGTPTQLNPGDMWANTGAEAEAYQSALAQSFEKIASGPPAMTENQKLELNFALQWGPGAPVGSQTAQLADLVMETVKEQIVANSDSPGSPFQPPTDFKKFKENLTKISSSLFENNVQKAVKEGKITQEEANKLIFARNTPEFADPSIRGLLNEFKDATSAQLKEMYGVPLDADIPVDTSKYASNLSANFSALVGQNLDKMAKELGLSDQQVAQLKFMHVHPEIDFPEKNALQGTLNKAENMAMQSMGKEFGIPSNFKPAPDTALFTGISQGFFKDELSNQLENFLKSDPSVNDQNVLLTRNLINFALANPDHPGVKPEILAIASQLISASWAKVGGNLGIPPGTLAPPSTGPLTGGSIDPETAQITRNGITLMSNQLAVGNSLALTMPAGPEKGLILNFLKTLSEALSALKEFLYTLESTDAEISKKQAISKKEQKLDQIKNEQIQMKKHAGQLAKMGVVTTVITVLTSVMTALMAIPIIGPIIASAFAPMAAAFAAMAATAGATVAAAQGTVATITVVAQLAYQAVKTVIIEIAKAAAQFATEALKNLVKEMIKAFEQIFTKQMVSNIAKGFTEMMKDTAKGLMSVGEMMYQAALSVVKFLGSVYQSVKDVSLRPIIEFLKETFSGIAEFMSVTKNMSFTEVINNKPLMDSIVTAIEEFSFKCEMILGTATGVMSGVKSIIQVDIVMSQAKVDEMREKIEALMKIMQKSIDSLLNGLAGIGQDAVDVTKLIDQMYEGHREALMVTQA